MAFDLTVHKRNAKGEVTHKDPYRLEIQGGVRRFERPVGSGLWYSEDGKMFPESVQKLQEIEDAEVKAKADKIAAAKAEAEELAAMKAKAAKFDAMAKELEILKSKQTELGKKS